MICLAIFSCVQLLRQTPQTIILTYHDVIERRDSSSLWFDVTKAELEQQMSWLRKNGAHFVSLGQVEAHLLRGAPLPRNPVAITFADNYEGFILRGYPILRKNGIPVTMFVHTGFVGAKNGRPKMSWAQLRSLASEGLFEVGSQTVTHRNLPSLSDGEVERELLQSKATIEKQLGRKVRYLAYPNGHWDIRCEATAQKAGYSLAFSEVTKLAELSPNPFAINRYVHTKYRKAWADAHR